MLATEPTRDGAVYGRSGRKPFRAVADLGLDFALALTAVAAMVSSLFGFVSTVIAELGARILPPAPVFPLAGPMARR